MRGTGSDGSRRAEALFREHHAALHRYLVRLTGDPERAADAAQEAFRRLLERPPADPGGLKGWLYRVATNAALEPLRTEGRRVRLLRERRERLTPEPPATPEETTERRALVRRVRRALESLGERDRTVLLMREEGFSHREIARAVGTTTGSVGTMAARALERLARVLDLDEEGAT